MNNSFAYRFPEYVHEWSDKNEMSLDEVAAFSHRKVWWKGECGHEWQMAVADRSNGHGCPYCNDHKLLKDFNDFKTLHPELAREWSNRNLPILPDMINEFTSGYFWWRCRQCGCEYRAWTRSRIEGSKCPYCSGRKIKVWINDLATTDPLIAEEWDYDMNSNVPYIIGRNSGKEIWWKGKCGHSWKATPKERTSGNLVCYKCMKEFSYNLPGMLLTKCFSEKRIKCSLNNVTVTGFPIDIFVPELKIAIFINVGRVTKQLKMNIALCNQKGIKCYLISDKLDVDQRVQMVEKLLEENNVYMKRNLSADRSLLWRNWIRKKEIMRKRVRERGPIDRLGAYLKRIFEIEKIFFQKLTCQVNL